MCSLPRRVAVFWLQIKRRVCVEKMASLYVHAFSFIALWLCYCALTTLVSGLPFNKDSAINARLQSSDPDYDRQVMVISNSPDGWTFCFEDKCRCKGDVADCSNNGGNLTFIPKLPETVTTLNFSFNRVGKIPDNFFDNVTGISDLHLENNNMVQISPVAFSKLMNLTKLSIASNSGLSYAKLDPVFAMMTLEELDISFCQLGLPVPDFFNRKPSPNWLTLSMRGNKMAPFPDLAVFANFKRLRKLDLSQNGIGHIFSSSGLDSIKTLIFQNNGVSQFPVTCNNNGSLFPNLAHLDLRSNGLTSVANVICLPSLQFLDLSKNGGLIEFTAGSGAFSSQLFPRLREIVLESMKLFGFHLDAFAFNNTSLQSISLANNMEMQADPDFLAGCSNLDTVILDGSFRPLFDNLVGTLKRFLQPVNNLQHLSLNDIGLYYNIHYQDLFSVVPGLVSLKLAGNSISSIPDGSFDGLLNLTTLDLSRNNLDAENWGTGNSPHEGTFSEATRNRLRSLDLSGNPFVCNCVYRWLYLWRQRDPDLFRSSTNYTCNGFPIGRAITGNPPLVLNAQACLFANEDSYPFSMIGSAFALCLLLCALYWFRKRLGMRQVMKRALLGHGADRNQQQRGGNVRYKYDLFVSYAEGDARWVRQHLMPELEGRRGLRLCIHQRDFHPGRHILDSIEDCVSLSKHVLMVFSPHFARSQWCQFEMTLCQRHAMDRGEYLLVAYLRRVEERDMTAGMMAILRTSTYLQWSNNRRDQAHFWNTLRIALEE